MEMPASQPSTTVRILRLLETRMELITGMPDSSPRRDVVILNGAAALALEDGDFHKGVNLAERSLSEGAALDKMERLIAFTQQVMQ